MFQAEWEAKLVPCCFTADLFFPLWGKWSSVQVPEAEVSEALGDQGEGCLHSGEH